MIRLVPRVVLRLFRLAFAAASRKTAHHRFRRLAAWVTPVANACDIELRYRALRDREAADRELAKYPAPQLIADVPRNPITGNLKGRTEILSEEQIKTSDPEKEV